MLFYVSILLFCIGKLLTFCHCLWMIYYWVAVSVSVIIADNSLAIEFMGVIDLLVLLNVISMYRELEPMPA
jgi:hypothetical protein